MPISVSRHSTVAFSWITLLFKHWWTVWTPASCGTRLQGSIYTYHRSLKTLHYQKATACQYHACIYSIKDYLSFWNTMDNGPESPVRLYLILSDPSLRIPGAWAGRLTGVWPTLTRQIPLQPAVYNNNKPKNNTFKLLPALRYPGPLSKHEVLSSVGLSLRCDPARGFQVGSIKGKTRFLNCRTANFSINIRAKNLQRNKPHGWSE